MVSRTSPLPDSRVPPRSEEFGGGQGVQAAERPVPMVIHSLINTSGQVDTKTINLDQIISIKYFSTRLKLLRVTALVLKFKELLRMPENISNIRVTAEDISIAERPWTMTTIAIFSQ